MKGSDAESDTVGTGDLAAWFGISVQAVGKSLRKAGLKPEGRGPHGQNMWPRLVALNVLNRRVGPRV
ncbi:hypothetical protein LGT39_12485 [Demequina sp. TTPB684]|uniref:hypothetical protein n=1 Tax=unclassified Demequina TaxID=2620311 RepID=UPI001CF333EE|nr:MULTISPECIES: hypothetical protein [unclassified Demequina]MCB2413662.1 hypothetical protein [Demequina sp. TTPB684]UPU87724.1 hypothetical protein LGT36_010740 [Demequina sp. TMPB413]